MFKPTKPLFRKRVLHITTKQTPNTTGYYKGNRSGSMGWHTKHSKYIIDRRKVRTYVAPRELFTGLTPFVPGSKTSPEDLVYGKTDDNPDSKNAQRREISAVEDAERHWLYGKEFMGRLDGHKYLLLWKAAAQARVRVLGEYNDQERMESSSEDALEDSIPERFGTERQMSTEKTSPER